jgi:hypothetical protein
MISVEAARITAILGPPKCGKTWALFHAAKLADSGVPFVMWSSTRTAHWMAQTATLFDIDAENRLFGWSVDMDRALRVRSPSYFLDEVRVNTWHELKSLGEFARTAHAGVVVTIPSRRTKDKGTTTRKLFEAIEPACATVWAFHKSIPNQLVCLKGEFLGGALVMPDPPDATPMHWVEKPRNQRGPDAWALLLKDPFAP